MAKLSKEERARYEAALAADDDADDDFTVTISEGDKKAEGVPYGKAKAWLSRNFGIDLDDTSQDDEPGDDEPKAPKAKAQGGEVRAFGRRIS